MKARVVAPRLHGSRRRPLALRAERAARSAMRIDVGTPRLRIILPLTSRYLMPQSKRMSLSSLKAMLASEKADALAAMSAAQLSGERARAQDYYLADMDQDMPALEGRSRAVSSDVADTIEGLMPSLMDIFCGSDEVVRFEPVGAEDEAAAATGERLRQPRFHAAESRLPGDLFLHQGCASVQGRHRQGVLGRARAGGARDLSRPVRRCLRAARAGRRSAIRRRAGDHRAHRHEPSPMPPLRRPMARDRKRHADARTTSRHASRRVRTLCAGARSRALPPEEFGIERGARTLRDCNYCFHDVHQERERADRARFSTLRRSKLSPPTPALTEIEDAGARHRRTSISTHVGDERRIPAAPHDQGHRALHPHGLRGHRQGPASTR